MSIKFTSSVGWILDEHFFYKSIYKDSEYEPKLEAYDIREPFMMDSQFNAMKKQLETGIQSRKRKRSVYSNESSEISLLCENVRKSFEQLMSDSNNYFSGQSTSSSNNIEARRCAKLCDQNTVHLSSLCDSIFVEDEEKIPVECESLMSISPDRLYRNSTDSHAAVKINCENEVSKEFLVPRNSNFVWGDYRLLKPYTSALGKFDLIVLDPPWENKSVKRKKTYQWSWENDLLKISINELLTEDGFVIIWVTNNARLQNFVQETLLPRWNLKLLARWYWLKVTTGGKPVRPFDSSRLPFEPIFVAGPTNSSRTIPQDSIVVSIPSAYHSRKPPLNDLFQSILNKTEPVSLEIFARYLLPNTTSIGNEVLKFQNLSCFSAKTT